MNIHRSCQRHNWGGESVCPPPPRWVRGGVLRLLVKLMEFFPLPFYEICQFHLCHLVCTLVPQYTYTLGPCLYVLMCTLHIY